MLCPRCPTFLSWNVSRSYHLRLVYCQRNAKQFSAYGIWSQNIQWKKTALSIVPKLDISVTWCWESGEWSCTQSCQHSSFSQMNQWVLAFLRLKQAKGTIADSWQIAHSLLQCLSTHILLCSQVTGMDWEGNPSFPAAEYWSHQTVASSAQKHCVLRRIFWMMWQALGK